MSSNATSNVLVSRPRRQGERTGEFGATADAFAHTSAFLDLATTVAALAPVPYVSTIFGSMKKIVDVVNVRTHRFSTGFDEFYFVHQQEMRQDKEGCADIARYAEDATVRVLGALIGREEAVCEALNSELRKFSSSVSRRVIPMRHLTLVLCSCMDEIKDFMESIASQRWIKRFAKRGRIHDSKAKYKDKLDIALRNFTVSRVRFKIPPLNEISRITRRRALRGSN